MPRLLIKFTKQQNQIFEFKETIVIGRGEDCSLILPNASVSREHAKIYIAGDEVILEDIGSQNGISLNGERLSTNERKVLNSRSEIQIGSFTLIFLNDTQEDNFYRGRSVLYLPQYNPNSLTGNTDSTFKLSAKEASTMLREKSLINNACIIDSSGKKLYPEANPITFGGKGATVKVSGWFTSGIIATINWDGKRHILTKNSGLFISITINGNGITQHPLTINDTIKIGKTSFQYVLDNSS
jgi:pSer/pThr/pTyr-binding forkhead associated (FHA) protein